MKRDETSLLNKVAQHAYLKAAPLGGVQDQELFKQVLAVCGHVEGNPVLAAQHALSQLLVEGGEGRGGGRPGKSMSEVMTNPPLNIHSLYSNSNSDNFISP